MNGRKMLSVGVVAAVVGAVGLAGAGRAAASPALPAAASAATSTASLVASWSAPAQVAQGAVAGVSVAVRSSVALHAVTVAFTRVGAVQVDGTVRRTLATLGAGVRTQVPVAFTVGAGTGTVRATVAGRDAAGNAVRTAVELDVATGAGRAVLSRSGLLDAQVGALGLQRGTLGAARYAAKVEAVRVGGAGQRIVATPATKAPVGTTAVAGTIRYTASDGSLHPARAIRVELRDADGTVGGTLVGSTSTDLLGHYTLAASTLRAGGAARQLLVRAVAQGVGFLVRGSTATAAQAIASAATTAHGTALTVDLTANNTADNNTAFDVADAMVTAIAYTRRINGGALLAPVLTVSFPDPDGTNFSGSTGVARILKLDRFDWDVLLHEYGHFVAHQMNFDQSPGGSHSYDENLGETRGKDAGVKVAWSEGFATYFGLSAEDALHTAALKIPHVGDSFYDDTEDSSFHVAYATKVGLPSLGEDNELSVGRVLWHFYKDPAIALPDTTVIDTLREDGPVTLSDAVYWLALAAGAAPFDDSTEATAGQVAHSNDLACLLTDQVVAPKITSVAPVRTGPAAGRPAITWTPNGAGPSNRLDDFTVQFWSPGWDTLLFESNEQRAAAYTPSAADWATVLAGTDTDGRLPATLHVVVKGWGLHDPQTGPYKSCAVSAAVTR